MSHSCTSRGGYITNNNNGNDNDINNEDSNDKITGNKILLIAFALLVTLIHMQSAGFTITGYCPDRRR